MKYLIYFLSFLILVGLIFFYIQISKPDISYKIKKEVEKKVEKQKTFKIEKVNFYTLPVRILYMKIDFNKLKYEIVYKVTISNVDKFAVFNIKTILDNYKIAYSLLKNKKTEIYIFFKNLQEANSVLNLFKEYNFNIKIQKIKKRI